MKKTLFNILQTEDDFDKINFNEVFDKKKHLFIILPENPKDIISIMEKTIHFADYFTSQFFAVDAYYFDFFSRLNLRSNIFLLSLEAPLTKIKNAVVLNLNIDFDIQDMMESFSESVFFDLNNNGNFVIEPSPKNADELLGLFSKFVSIKPMKTKIKYNVEKKYDNGNKKLLIFDIQNIGNEKSIDVLLKNLNVLNNTALEIIWRAGSVDFNYSHIDCDNFLQYYEAIVKADMFFTDDKNFADFLHELECNFIFLGKNLENEDIKAFNPKNIFELKNHILEFLDRKRIL